MEGCRSTRGEVDEFDEFSRGVPLHGPGHGDGEFFRGVQHLDQVLPAGRTDGPQRVGAALQLSDDQVVWHVALQPLQGSLRGPTQKHSMAHEERGRIPA